VYKVSARFILSELSETCFSSGLLIISYGMLLNIHPDLRQAVKLVSDSAVQRRVDVSAKEKKKMTEVCAYSYITAFIHCIDFT